MAQKHQEEFFCIRKGIIRKNFSCTSLRYIIFLLDSVCVRLKWRIILIAIMLFCADSVQERVFRKQKYKADNKYSQAGKFV